MISFICFKITSQLFNYIVFFIKTPEKNNLTSVIFLQALAGFCNENILRRKRRFCC